MGEQRDVVVVGGGPVGVAMGMMCARRGLSAVVLERSTEVYDLPRAIVMDDEIQRAVALAGAGDGLRAVISPLPGAEFVDAAGTRIIGLEIPDGFESPLGFPPVARYYQPDLEHFLRSSAVAAGASLQLGVEAVSFEQQAEGVTVSCADGSIEHGRWLVAADGAASPIRKSLGIAFDDQGFDQDWLVVDVRLHDGAEPALPLLVRQVCDPARPTTFVPGHDRYRRWEFQLQQGETRESMTSPERVWSLLSPWLTPDDARLVRAVVYRFHATVASTMRSGSVFIAGDAAHQMPPFLGQGLCSGVRDAANLAWKLEMVKAGSAGDRLLDTYDLERRPHAAGVVAHAVDTGRLIDQLAGRGGGQDGLDSAYGGQRPFPHLVDGFRTGDHPLVGRQMPNVPCAVGGRLDDVTLRDGHDGIVVAVPDSWPMDGGHAAALSAWKAIGAAVVSVAEPVAFGAHAAVIVRPDRYVAAVSAAPAEFAAHTASLMEALR